MVTNKHEAKAMTGHILSDCKCKCNGTKCYSNKNGMIKHVNVNAKMFISVKKIIFRILAHVFVKIVSI